MLNYGLMLGLAGVLLSVIIFAVGKTYDQHWSVSVISVLISVAIIVLGIKKFKESKEGYLSLSDALKIGLGIALIGGIISVIYTFIFTSYIEPDYFKNMGDVQFQKMLEQNPTMSDEQLDAINESMKKFSGPGITSAFIIIWSLFTGFIISLIGGAIMRKSKEE
jgi:hypothetical protein